MPSTIDQYVCIKTLGQGAFGKVKLAKNKGGQLCALKIYPKDSPNVTEQSLKTLQDEAQAYMNLDNKHIIRMLEFKVDAVWKKSSGKEIPVAYMVIEYVSSGELFDYVADERFSPSICRYYLK